MAWSQLGLAVAGGTVGALLTQAATFARDWLIRKDDAWYAALSLALALEGYASEEDFNSRTYFREALAGLKRRRAAMQESMKKAMADAGFDDSDKEP